MESSLYKDYEALRQRIYSSVAYALPLFKKHVIIKDISTYFQESPNKYMSGKAPFCSIAV